METDLDIGELYKEAFNRAPKDVQDYIASGDLEKFLTRMRTQFRLPDSVAALAGHEIVMALLNITNPDELPVAFEVDARVPDEVIDPLVIEVREAVFGPLRAKLEKVGLIPVDASSKESAKEAAEVAPPPPINRLKPALKPEVPVTAPVPPTPPVPPPTAAPPIPKPFGADIAAPLVKPAVIVPPPVVADTPSLVGKTRPGEPSAPVTLKPSTSPTKLDPYRELPE